MPAPFLKAHWQNLLMANYEIDPDVLKKYVPPHVELDTFEDRHYVSLVGFLFAQTRVRGIRFPFHHTFEEVNLRFYVRYRGQSGWKRGVVFIREMVPRRMISLIANSLYGEKYTTHPMRREWKEEGDQLHVGYYWKVGSDWNYLKATAAREPQALVPGSEEAFITEHYWGYTTLPALRTGEYQVAHPQWRIHPVRHYDIRCHTEKLYGAAFAPALAAEPRSVFLAEGSEVEVMPGGRLR